MRAPIRRDPSRRATSHWAVVERLALRLIYIAAPSVLLIDGGRGGYAALAAIVGGAQFLGSARVAIRTQAAHESFYVGVGESLARTNAMVPLPLPDVEPELALGRALYANARLTTDVTPTIYGEGIALGGAVVLLTLSPFRALLLPLAGAALVATTGYALFRRRVRRREDHAQDLLVDVHAQVMLFLAERTERVAQGASDAFLRGLATRVHEHRRAAAIASTARLLLRRVPLALATLVAWALASSMHLATNTDAVHALIFLAVAQGAVSLLTALTERGQHEVDAKPLVDLLALPREKMGGEKKVTAVHSIKGRDVAFSYDGIKDAVAHFSFDVAAGKPLILRGENGSGKSTVLKLVLGLGAPRHGAIEIDGTSLTEIAIDAWREKIAFVAQATPFDANAEVRVAMRAIEPALSDDAMTRALESLGLSPGRDWLSKKMGTLSSGQRRRVQLARAFALERPVLVLDEPEAGLDAATQKRVRDLVARAAAEKLVVVATHSELFDEGIRLTRAAEIRAEQAEA